MIIIILHSTALLSLDGPIRIRSLKIYTRGQITNKNLFHTNTTHYRWISIPLNFFEVNILCNVNKSDFVTVNCYHNELHQKVQQEMVMYNFYTIDDIHRKIRHVEPQLQEHTIRLFSFQSGESSIRKEGRINQFLSFSSIGLHYRFEHCQRTITLRLQLTLKRKILCISHINSLPY